MAEMKEMESFSVFGYGSAGSAKRKRRRRVSFATTQTVHFIPRKDDVETPPLDPGNVALKPTPPPPRPSSPAFPCLLDNAAAAAPACPDLPPDPNEHTGDFSHFTCDMDTDHGSWAEEDTNTRMNSLEGDEDDSGCFVNFGYSDQGDDESIVNDDITMDATTFTKNLSQVLKSGTTFDSEFWNKISPQKILNESASESVDDSMAFTKQGSLHRNITHHDVSFHADDIESDMSTGTRIQTRTLREDMISVKNCIRSYETRPLSQADASHRIEISQRLHSEASHVRSVEALCNKTPKGSTIQPCYKQEDTLEDEVTSSARDPHTDCEADLSMILGNTMDISLHRPVPKVPDALMHQLDGNSHNDSVFSLPSNNSMDTSLHQQRLKNCEVLDGNIDCDSEISMSLNNTMDISLHPKGSDVFVNLGGDRLTSSVSGQRSGGPTLSATVNSMTMPGHNLKDLLSDYTDYTVTKTHLRGVPMCNDDSISLTFGGSRLLASSKPSCDSLSPEFVDQKSPTGMIIVTETKSKAYSGISDNKLEESTPINVQSASWGGIIDIPNKGNSQSKLTDTCERLLKSTKQAGNPSHLNVDGRLNLTGELKKVPRKNAAEKVLVDITNKELSQTKSMDMAQKNFRETKQVHAQSQVNGNSKLDACGDNPKHFSNKITESVRKIGILSNLSRRSHSKITVDGILQCLQDECNTVDLPDKEETEPLLMISNLQTLSDYLRFSCSRVQQLDMLNDHIEELTEKLKSLKETNLKLRVSNNVLQKLKEDSLNNIKSKFEKKKGIARKEWILWKISPERQNLALLQDNKDNLIREVDAAKAKVQQVLQLKDAYTQALLCTTSSGFTSFQNPAVNSSTVKKNQGEEKGLSQSAMLEKCRLYYEDTHKRLQMVDGNREEIHKKIDVMMNEFDEKCFHAMPDIDGAIIAEKMKQANQVAALSITFLQHQQVMRIGLNSKEGKSQTEFSIGRMYQQILQYEGDGPLALANIYRSVNREAIDMAFPCMDASVAFQYLVSDVCNIITVQVQHLHQLMQRTKWVFGCLMDLLKEIKYCQRAFRMSCKFQIRDDKLMLTQTMLRSSVGLKISLVYDTMFLRGGRYPTDLRPADVLVRSYGSANNSITRRDVNTLVAKLEPGFGRIYRICSSVGKFMSGLKEVS